MNEQNYKCSGGDRVGAALEEGSGSSRGEGGGQHSKGESPEVPNLHLHLLLRTPQGPGLRGLWPPARPSLFPGAEAKGQGAGQAGGNGAKAQQADCPRTANIPSASDKTQPEWRGGGQALHKQPGLVKLIKAAVLSQPGRFL
jgi:hypothetical protein